MNKEENNISNEELKEIVDLIISKKMGFEEICRVYKHNPYKLKFDILTYLQESNNIEILKQWLRLEPYKSNEIKVDYISVIKHIIKTRRPVVRVREELGLKKRVYSYNIAKLRNSDEIDEETEMKYKELMEIYERSKINELTNQDSEIIQKIRNVEVISLDRIENKRKRLESIIFKYENLIESGFSEIEAAKTMDMLPRDINRYRKELYGLEQQEYYNKGIKTKELEKQGEEK